MQRSDLLKEAAKDVLRRARDMQAHGSLPLVLGTQGLIALMWDKFQRTLRELPTNREKAIDELQTMVAEGFLVYFSLTEEHYKAWAEMEEQEQQTLLEAWTDDEEEEEQGDGDDSGLREQAEGSSGD
jgi:hypothetical protein